jgi:menaquinone-9 beta-reductase
LSTNADVLVSGAGPAGLATAIAASLKGFRVIVADPRKPPIDKTCGEGLLPKAVSALRHLGVPLRGTSALSLSGILFSDDEHSASAPFVRGSAYGLRRTALHQLLVERAAEVGVRFLWGARISDFEPQSARAGGTPYFFRWLVGADGYKSQVRSWAGLEPVRAPRARFGFRRHYSMVPWSDAVEVYWEERCQLFVTPAGPGEVCIAVLSDHARLRVDSALPLFPEVVRRLRSARPSSPELGAPTLISQARAAVRGPVALVGDASFTLDAISGEGMSLAFAQALELADAFARNDLARYATAHCQMTLMPMRITRLLLTLARRPWLRRKAMRLFAGNPGIFSRVLALHTGEISSDDLKVKEVFGLGWQVLRA